MVLSRINRKWGRVLEAVPRMRVQRRLVEGGVHRGKKYEGLATILARLKPEELRKFIERDGSVVRKYWLRDPEGLVAEGLEAARRNKRLAHQVVMSINWNEVFSMLERKVPEQARIIREHPQWYRSEVQEASKIILKELDKA